MQTKNIDFMCTHFLYIHDLFLHFNFLYDRREINEQEIIEENDVYILVSSDSPSFGNDTIKVCYIKVYEYNKRKFTYKDISKTHSLCGSFTVLLLMQLYLHVCLLTLTIVELYNTYGNTTENTLSDFLLYSLDTFYGSIKMRTTDLYYVDNRNEVEIKPIHFFREYVYSFVEQGNTPDILANIKIGDVFLNKANQDYIVVMVSSLPLMIKKSRVNFKRLSEFFNNNIPTNKTEGKSKSCAFCGKIITKEEEEAGNCGICKKEIKFYNKSEFVAPPDEDIKKEIKGTSLDNLATKLEEVRIIGGHSFWEVPGALNETATTLWAVNDTINQEPTRTVTRRAVNDTINQEPTRAVTRIRLRDTEEE